MLILLVYVLHEVILAYFISLKYKIAQYLQYTCNHNQRLFCYILLYILCAEILFIEELLYVTDIHIIKNDTVTAVYLSK